MKSSNRWIPALIVSMAALVVAVRAGARPAPTGMNEGANAPERHFLSADVRRVAVELREKAFAGTRAADWVKGLSDEVGSRLSGSRRA